MSKSNKSKSPKCRQRVESLRIDLTSHQIVDGLMALYLRGPISLKLLKSEQLQVGSVVPCLRLKMGKPLLTPCYS